MSDLIGQTLGQYRIIEQIGEGGMATVYKAYQPGLDRYVALKVLPPVHAKQPGFSERFEREAKAIANLNHPNILPVYDFGQKDEYSFIAMRYIGGASTLRQVMNQSLSLTQIADLIGQVAAALDHAHRQGVIHRDVKPSNVLMDNNWALLTDFGLAKMTEASVKLTGTGVGVGTPSYMSPEQGQGQPVDHRTDIYALGIILFEMLTGQIPHDAETPFAIILKRVSDPLPPPRSINPDIPEAVERVVLKALATVPNDRYQLAGDLAEALQQAVEEKAPVQPISPEPERASATPAAGKPAATAARASSAWFKPVLMVGAGGLFLLLIALIGVVAFMAGRAGQSTPEPQATAQAAGPSTPSPVAAMATPAASVTATTSIALPATPTPLSRILYKVKEGNTESLYLTDLDGSEPYLLASGADEVSGRFSPEAQRIIVRLERDEKDTLYLVDADGNNRQVLASNLDDGWATFSSDGQHIRIRQRRGDFHDLVIVNADGSHPVKLVSGSDYYVSSDWARDSQKVAVSVKQGEQYTLFVLNRDGSERQIIAGGQSNHYYPRLSDDGQRLIYETQEEATDEDSYDTYTLYLASADGSQAKAIMRNADSIWSSGFSASGQRFLVGARETREDPYDLYVVDAETGQPVRLLSGDSVRGRFSPNEQWILAYARRDDVYRLYVISVDGAQHREVLFPGERASWGGLSPDEQWVVASIQQDENYRLYVSSIDGTRQQEIVGDNAEADWYANAYFSPEGKYLLVRLADQDPCCYTSLYVIAIDGSHQVELARQAAWQLSGSFTPDGQHVVFDSNRDGKRAIYVAHVDGSNVQKLVNGYSPYVASGRPAVMYVRSTPHPTSTPTPESTETSLEKSTPTSTPTNTKTPLPTPSPSPTSTPIPASESRLSLQTSAPRTPIDAGQSVSLGLRNKWGTSGETHAFECIVFGPDGSQSAAEGVVKRDDWAAVNYPGDFAGASPTVAGEYRFVFWVEGQQVEDKFTVTGSTAPADPEREAAIEELKAGVKARQVDMLSPLTYSGSMVFGYFASGQAVQTDSTDEKRSITQEWFNKWSMQPVDTGAEKWVLASLSGGIATHQEATERAVVVFKTGAEVSDETPEIIFLLEKIEEQWWWTATLLAIFDLSQASE